MSQGPGAASPENSLSPQDDSGWITPRNRRRAYGRGRGDRLAQHGTIVGGTSNSTTLSTTLNAASPTTEFKVPYYKKNYETLDLHGLPCAQALEKLKDKIISVEHNMKGKFEQLTIITGKGNHSPGGKPSIKPAVLDYLRQNDIVYKEQDNNSGRIDIIVYK